MGGPLSGFRILELAGIGPGPFCGMMLADMGADVIRIDRPGGNPSSSAGHTVLFRSRRTAAINLKDPDGVETVLRLCEKADALIEGNRPGVAERLGVGPDACLRRNPKLVYGRMTGWGQDGPLAQTAGHDMNYIALTGALHAIGRRGQAPVPPLNLVGDFGGGGMLLAYGVVCALLHAQRTGEGQVVDAAMIDGAAALMAMFCGLRAQGLFEERRGTNLLDSGAPFYDTYETKDGKYVSIGSLEPQFYALLKDTLKLSEADFGLQMNPAEWPAQKEKLAAIFRTRTRDEWCALLEGTDVCFAPVLALSEAPAHPHNVARKTFVEVDGVMQAAPAPRFSRTHPAMPQPARPVGADTRAVLTEAGFTATEIDTLARKRAVECL